MKFIEDRNKRRQVITICWSQIHCSLYMHCERSNKICVRTKDRKICLTHSLQSATGMEVVPSSRVTRLLTKNRPRAMLGSKSEQKLSCTQAIVSQKGKQWTKMQVISQDQPSKEQLLHLFYWFPISFLETLFSILQACIFETHIISNLMNHSPTAIL